MGQPVYVITSPHDAVLVLKKVDNLSMDGWVTDLMEQFGASSSSIQAMWSPVPEYKDESQPKEFEKALQVASEEPLAHICQLLFRLNLSPGEQADAIQSCLLGAIHERMTWKGMPGFLVLTESDNSRVISLLKWSQYVLLEGATTSFFGKALLQVEPDLFKSFCEFDDSSWKLSYRIPGIWARDVRRSKGFVQDSMKRYFDLPTEMRSDATYLIHSIETRMRAVGIGSKDIGTLVLMFYWVINANAWKTSFWMLVYIANDPILYQNITNEITPILSASPQLAPIELASRLSECARLVAVYNETIRLTASSVSVRTVVGPANIDNLNLEKGARLVIPYRQMLLDEQFFGADAQSFNHERFFHNPALAKSPSYKPFGGGTTLCPGRILAQREVLLFVALAVGKFKLGLGTGLDKTHRQLPELETKNPCIGIMGPVTGQDVHINVRKPHEG
ncbi:hypothetical protein G7Y89_g4783 [Cudoniella acicularis]|uniref:Cytochrome P450 n=1 Tax=Cudoniella acicularis TaxID=354080 RepID=A0A8H4W4M3_9HELO|nr:hypothetical protein G7Y89_g4783 [Cudoniella acicularis]